MLSLSFQVDSLSAEGTVQRLMRASLTRRLQGSSTSPVSSSPSGSSEMVADVIDEVPVIDCAYSMQVVMADGSLGRERHSF
jgi:hypothetical protein